MVLLVKQDFFNVINTVKMTKKELVLKRFRNIQLLLTLTKSLCKKSLTYVNLHKYTACFVKKACVVDILFYLGIAASKRVSLTPFCKELLLLLRETEQKQSGGKCNPHFI